MLWIESALRWQYRAKSLPPKRSEKRSGMHGEIGGIWG